MTNNYELSLVNQGYIEYPTDYDQGITWPNIGVFFKGELLLQHTFYGPGSGKLKYYKFDNYFGMYSEKTWTITMTCKYSSLEDIYFIATKNTPKKNSNMDIYDIVGDEPYLFYWVNKQEYINNGNTVDTSGIDLPNIHKEEGTIFLKFEKNRVFSGNDINSAGYICEIDFDKYINVGIVVCGEGEGEYYFKSNYN